MFAYIVLSKSSNLNSLISTSPDNGGGAGSSGSSGDSGF